jgi:hypothetical protein
MKIQPKLEFETWPVIRSKPAPKAYGRSISLFINNAQCHLTTVDVYEDGSIDCWGFVDRDLFKSKVHARWVVPSPKAGQHLSVHNFGFTGISAGHWFQSPESILGEVDSIVRRLNPRMLSLIDMQGSAPELRGKISYAKMGLSDKTPFRVEATGQRQILADSVPILRRLKHDAGFQLTRLFAYADGLLRLGTSGNLFEAAALDALFSSGEMANSAPAKTLVTLPGLGDFRTTEQFGGVSDRDRVTEVNDMIGVLQGKPSLLVRCRASLADYKKAPTIEAEEALRAAYQAVPTHLRPYCGDMNTRDTEIRRILCDTPGKPLG